MKYQFQPTCQIPVETLDQIYLDAFGFKKDGCFVEIGAHDGWHWSCTWGLAEIGWTGLYAEPVPKLYNECLATNAHRLNVKTVRCCIGDMNGEGTLHDGLYGASTVLWQDGPVVTAPKFTLDKFLEDNDIEPRFDLLVVDVEYAEDKALKAFTCSEWQPKLAIIETTYPHSKDAAEVTFAKPQYNVVYTDWINTVYSRNA